MTLDTLRDEARDLHDETVAMRRRLHERPEIGNDLPITREVVLESLEGLPLDVTLHETTSGVAALLTGGKPGPTVLLRGDMDALPLPRGHRTRLLLQGRPLDARLRARHAHRDARRRGEGAVGAPGRHPRPGAVHVPAG